MYGERCAPRPLYGERRALARTGNYYAGHPKMGDVYGESAAVLADVLADAPPERTDGTWPSTVTSVDVKLAYDGDGDRFVAVLVGDVNANPEGIALVHGTRDGGVVASAVDAYLSNVAGTDLRIVATLSPGALDSAGNWRDETWLTRDRRALVEALVSDDRVATLDRAVSAHLAVEDGALVLPGVDASYDGYVNLDDTGTALLAGFQGDVTAMSEGANAPTAVWTPELASTGKDELLTDAASVAERVGGVRTPRHRRVRTIGDLESFRRTVEGPVVLKGPFGTHGDEVVTIPPGADVAERVDQEERRIRQLRNWPEFSIRDGQRFVFRHPDRAPVGYGLVEEGIDGEMGDFQVVDHVWDGQRCPLDFVPLAVRSGDGVAVPSVLVRASSRTDLNANTSSRYTTFEPLEKCLAGAVPVDHPDADVHLDLRAELEAVAGRPVELAELRGLMERAGTVALAARNRSALRAEQTLAEC